MDLTNLFFAQYKTVEDCVAPLLLGPVINLAPRRSKVSLALIGFSFTATTQQGPLGWGPPPPRPPLSQNVAPVGGGQIRFQVIQTETDSTSSFDVCTSTF